MLPTTTSLKKPQILVVEDNYFMAKTVCELVRDCGYDVAGAVGRVDAGKQFLEDNEIDGAIVDINLDGMPSFAICDELTRRKVPFFFLTAYERSIIPDAFRNATLLTKPVEMADFRSALTGLAPYLPVIAERPAVPTGDRRNLLLDRLTPECWATLKNHLTQVPMKGGAVLEEAGRLPEHVYFPVDGLLSVQARSSSRTIEVAMVGREGMTGLAAVLGADAPAHRTVVQFPGDAWKLETALLPRLLKECDGLQEVLLGYAHELIGQISETAFVVGHARIEQRLARWLLMVGERTGADRIEVTHSTLAQALGVRRAGITVALHLLESKNLIKSVRRLVRVIDWEGLKGFAGEFHQPLVLAAPDRAGLLSGAMSGDGVGEKADDLS